MTRNKLILNRCSRFFVASKVIFCQSTMHRWRVFVLSLHKMYIICHGLVHRLRISPSSLAFCLAVFATSIVINRLCSQLASHRVDAVRHWLLVSEHSCRTVCFLRSSSPSCLSILRAWLDLCILWTQYSETSSQRNYVECWNQHRTRNIRRWTKQQQQMRLRKA